MLKTLEREGCRVLRRYGRTGRILSVRVPGADAERTEAVLGRLADVAPGTRAGMASVRFLVPLGFPSAVPDDPRLSSQWALTNIGADRVWAQGMYGFPNIPCAVFDTGVRTDHEDLQENVVRRVSALRSSASPADHHGHGSHCLGIMGADGNNGKGITGVGQIANLTSIRGPISYWEEGDSILDGYQWALDNRIRILSCSFGTAPGTGGYDEAEYALLNELAEAGCLVVVAAGNDGNDNDRAATYPACYDCDNIITVVCTNEENIPANMADNGWATNYGAETCDIGAPGTDIVSCTAASASAYEAWSGTSMATPLVAAGAAMVWERNPTWGYRDVRDRLYRTAVPEPSLIGRCTTGARFSLIRALSQTETVSVGSLPAAAFEYGAPITLTVTPSEGIGAVTLTLLNRDDTTFSKALGTFPVIPGQPNGIEAWTPAEADVLRGYYIRIQADGDPEAFAYTSVFRVKRPGEVSFIAVTSPEAGKAYDADGLPVTFSANDTVMASFAIEERTEDGRWQLVMTLGSTAHTPGEGAQTVRVGLKGLGWISERPYRIVVTDEDDPSVTGISPEFTIAESSCSVVLLPGNADSQKASSGSDASWQSTYRAGEEFRLSCWLPETSLYWLLIIDEKTGLTRIAKTTWTDVSTGTLRSYRTFGLALPEDLGPGPFRFRLADAFSPELYGESPPFTVGSRADGRPEPSVGAALGDTGRAYIGNGQWYPEPAPGTEAGWHLRCGWVGSGETATFEADFTGPAEIAFDLTMPRSDGATLTVARTAPPALAASVWTELFATAGFGGAGGTPETITVSIPEGTHTVRWTYARAAGTAFPKDGAGTATVGNVRTTLTAMAPTIGIDRGSDPAKARISGGEPWPGRIVYTLDGSDPDETSPQWPPELSLPLTQSVTIRARCIRQGYNPSPVVSAQYTDLAGSGTAEDPFRIRTADDLRAFAESVSAGTSYAGQTLCLENDIDLSGRTLPTAGWLDNSATLPTRRFSGTFDGRGHTLIAPVFAPTFPPRGGDVPEYDGAAGFVACLGEGAVLRNLTLDRPVIPQANADISAAGFLAAYHYGTIENCHVIGGELIAPGCIHAGGLYGFAETDPQAPVRPKTVSSTFTGTINGEALRDDTGDGAVYPEPTVFLPVPQVSPAPGPIAADTDITVTPADPAHGLQQLADDGRTWEPTDGLIRLSHAPGKIHTLTFRSAVKNADGSQTVSAPLTAVYSCYERPAATELQITDENGTPLQDGMTVPPLTVRAVLRTVRTGNWTLVYTTDGSEPDRTSTPYTGPIDIPGDATVRARAYADPWYTPGPVASCRIRLDRTDPENRADLTLIRATRVEGEYLTERFVIRADAPGPGERFSHWLVTGPLVLDDPTDPEAEFFWMTREPVTLEAVFRPAGFLFRLR